MSHADQTGSTPGARAEPDLPSLVRPPAPIHVTVTVDGQEDEDPIPGSAPPQPGPFASGGNATPKAAPPRTREG